MNFSRFFKISLVSCVSVVSSQSLIPQASADDKADQQIKKNQEMVEKLAPEARILGEAMNTLEYEKRGAHIIQDKYRPELAEFFDVQLRTWTDSTLRNLEPHKDEKSEKMRKALTTLRDTLNSDEYKKTDPRQRLNISVENLRKQDPIQLKSNQEFEMYCKATDHSWKCAAVQELFRIKQDELKDRLQLLLGTEGLLEVWSAAKKSNNADIQAFVESILKRRMVKVQTQLDMHAPERVIKALDATDGHLVSFNPAGEAMFQMVQEDSAIIEEYLIENQKVRDEAAAKLKKDGMSDADIERAIEKFPLNFLDWHAENYVTSLKKEKIDILAILPHLAISPTASRSSQATNTHAITSGPIDAKRAADSAISGGEGQFAGSNHGKQSDNSNGDK